MRPQTTTQTATRTATEIGGAETGVDAAARRLYDAEVALHAAHASHVDAWIAAAADRLHLAVEAHLRAVAAAE